MTSQQLEYGMGEPGLKQKKLSREERKLERIVKLIDKMESSNPRLQMKAKPQNPPATGIAKPRKKIKTEMGVSEKQSITNDFESSSASDLKEKPKLSSVINSLYMQNLKEEEIYAHLIQYEMNERAKYLEAISNEKINLTQLPSSSQGLKLLQGEAKERTSKACAKIQNKFEQLKSKLTRPNSKEHKQFVSQYMNINFLLQ